MDCAKIGNIIRNLRTEKKMTQKQLAERLNISDKTISKWERGIGCPDVSLLTELSSILQVNLEEMLSGSLEINDFVGGNMKNNKYYICAQCGNVSICTGSAEISCCGRKLNEMVPVKADATKRLNVEKIEDDWHVTSNHPMNKEHYISFVALVTGEMIQLIKQYPEWDLSVRLPQRRHGMLVWYCVKEGLHYQLI